MAFGGELASSPAHEQEGSLAYYKTQYEQLEAELADFQASSKELEAELEKDVEAAEKRERQLQEKVEELGYEVEEWKTKCKQSKAEANMAQNALQKEITSLRDAHRTVHLRLRDIEVSNDDMERQARNTTSSLEDLESKYNVAIERGVMAEEEIRSGEQERESLRIETQRLRDELNDLRIEADIRQDKLRKAEDAIERQQRRRPSPIAADLPRPQSAFSGHSPTTSTSSPTIATPPTKSASSTVSETPTPPSPPTSDKSTSSPLITSGLPLPKSRLSIQDPNTTPRPANSAFRASRHSRRPSIPVSNDRTNHLHRRTTMNRPDTTQRGQGLVTSGSLHHLHGLMNKMHLLEQRVHTARSKLPAPTSTPPGASPRSRSSLGEAIPATVTLRSTKKRTGGSNASSIHTPTDRPSSRLSSTFKPNIDRPASRLSFGIPQPSPGRDMNAGRPPCRDATSQRPPSRDPQNSRPSSRASLSSRQSISHLPSGSVSSTSRPSSRQSMTGTRTPLGHYATHTQSESRRPRSSIGGSYASAHGGHGHSASVSRISTYGLNLQNTDEEETADVLSPTPSRRTTDTTMEQNTALPTSTGTNTRLSGVGAERRTSFGAGYMGPPERRGIRRLSEVGESY